MIPKTKNQVQVEQQILYNLAQVVEAFPQYTTAQHLLHILRRKKEVKESYDWSDELLLSKFEAYYDELKTDLVNNQPDEEY